MNHLSIFFVFKLIKKFDRNIFNCQSNLLEIVNFFHKYIHRSFFLNCSTYSLQKARVGTGLTQNEANAKTRNLPLIFPLERRKRWTMI